MNMDSYPKAMLDLDHWLNRRVFNPAARTIQRWAHVNKYHLIAIAYVSFIALWLLSACIGWVEWFLPNDQISSENWLFWHVLDLIIVVFFIIFPSDLFIDPRRIWSHGNALEEMGYVQTPIWIKRLPLHYRLIRPFGNVAFLLTISTVMIRMCFASWNTFLDGDSFSPFVGTSWQTTTYHVFIIALTTFCHLLDVDDVPPKDRAFLLSPAEQRAE